jgi:hypothetical protein
VTASLPPDRARARAVTAAVAAAADEAGVTLDDRLVIWSLAGDRPPAAPGRPGHAGADAAGPVGADAPGLADLLGRALESATADHDRKALGLHVTPGWLADRLVTMALPPGRVPGTGGGPTVCDPACGGGAFLLAAARHLHARGLDRRRVVGDLLWGADVDPVGLAAAEAALALWAGESPPPGRLVLADPLVAGRAVWPAAPPSGFDAVVGNPLFQSQLGRATARDAADRRRLRQRYGGAVRAYTDTAWLFLLLGCELVRPGGRVVLVEPQSVVAARDAGAVREAVDRVAVLRDLWLDDGRVFSAAVRVCAPVLERRAAVPGHASGRPAVAGAVGAGPGGHDPVTGDDGPGGPGSWAERWAAAVGLPDADLGAGPALGERAAVVAGFRDQYYGLVDAVREHEPADPPGSVAPLVTSGAVDWAACTWRERPVRYAKRRWHAPVVDLERLADAPPAARRWVDRTRVPKLVVATQTRVVEAAVDVEGAWVPSVPALAVVPRPGPGPGLWHLAAAVLSPAATAWLVRRAGGTGLERGALKVAGPDLAALPLPAGPGGDCWDAAAAALARFAAGRDDAALDAYLDAIGRAYGTPAALDRWWRQRAGTVVRSGAVDG